jgi:hypothetical protein
MRNGHPVVVIGVRLWPHGRDNGPRQRLPRVLAMTEAAYDVAFRAQLPRRPCDGCRGLLMRYIMRRTRTKALCFGETDVSEDLGMDAGARVASINFCKLAAG